MPKKRRDIVLKNLINAHSIKKMRRLISENKKREHLFRLRKHGKKFGKVERISNGEESSVVLPFGNIFPGDFLIHNHPSGNIGPSKLDIYFYSRLAFYEIGGAIVNNDVTEISVVAFPPKQTYFTVALSALFWNIIFEGMNVSDRKKIEIAQLVQDSMKSQLNFESVPCLADFIKSNKNSISIPNCRSIIKKR